MFVQESFEVVPPVADVVEQFVAATTVIRLIKFVSIVILCPVRRFVAA
jgi:hypothetical protein